jgi:hypothetical protein
VPVKDVYVRALCADFRQRLIRSGAPKSEPYGPRNRLVA